MTFVILTGESDGHCWLKIRNCSLLFANENLRAEITDFLVLQNTQNNCSHSHTYFVAHMHKYCTVEAGCRKGEEHQQTDMDSTTE